MSEAAGAGSLGGVQPMDTSQADVRGPMAASTGAADSMTKSVGVDISLLSGPCGHHVARAVARPDVGHDIAVRQEHHGHPRTRRAHRLPHDGEDVSAWLPERQRVLELVVAGGLVVHGPLREWSLGHLVLDRGAARARAPGSIADLVAIPGDADPALATDTRTDGLRTSLRYCHSFGTCRCAAINCSRIASACRCASFFVGYTFPTVPHCHPPFTFRTGITDLRRSTNRVVRGLIIPARTTQDVARRLTEHQSAAALPAQLDSVVSLAHALPSALATLDALARPALSQHSALLPRYPWPAMGQTHELSRTDSPWFALFPASFSAARCAPNPSPPTETPRDGP